VTGPIGRRLATILVAQLFAATAMAQTPAAPAAKPSQQNDPNAIITSANVPLPQRETDYIKLIFRARRQYAAGRSVEARRDARMDMQIAVHQFMGLAHDARGWIGVFRSSTKKADGRESLAIEIAPGVTVGTWDNPGRDKGFATMVQPDSRLGKAIDGLAIGDTVVFSADLLGTMVGGDDDMIQRPQVVARFTAVAKYEEPAPPK
jgi:hypothetical protein